MTQEQPATHEMLAEYDRCKDDLSRGIWAGRWIELIRGLEAEAEHSANFAKAEADRRDVLSARVDELNAQVEELNKGESREWVKSDTLDRLQAHIMAVETELDAYLSIAKEVARAPRCKPSCGRGNCECDGYQSAAAEIINRMRGRLKA